MDRLHYFEWKNGWRIVDKIVIKDRHHIHLRLFGFMSHRSGFLPFFSRGANARFCLLDSDETVFIKINNHPTSAYYLLYEIRSIVVRRAYSAFSILIEWMVIGICTKLNYSSFDQKWIYVRQYISILQSIHGVFCRNISHFLDESIITNE